MTTDALARSLMIAYEQALERGKTAAVVLFGIANRNALKGHPVAEGVARSGIGKWGPQVSPATKLSGYVVR